MGSNTDPHKVFGRLGLTKPFFGALIILMLKNDHMNFHFVTPKHVVKPFGLPKKGRCVLCKF